MMILSLVMASLIPVQAFAADNGNWLAILKTVNGGSRCAKEYRISFQINDGVLSGVTRADGIAWTIKGKVKGNGDVKSRATGVMIGSPVNRFFARINGTSTAKSGSGTWKTTGGCAGTMTMSKTR
jgi:hypothetical protein